MPVKLKVLTSWSFSRYSDYQQCPLKAKLKHIDKIKEPPNAAMERGAHIGELAEKYIKGELKALPVELKLFKTEFTMLRKQHKVKPENGMVVEDNWAFRKDWTETTWDDWANCWVRIKLDCAHHVEEDVLKVIDWKTGKHRPDNLEAYMEQLDLYALGALLTYPHINQVQVVLGFLDHGIWEPKVPKVYLRAELPGLKKAWEARVKKMLSDTLFAPRPNRFCGWCHFRKANKENGGGQCQY